MTEHLIGTWHEIYSDDPDYRAEGMANDVAQQVALKMEALGISRSELAEALGVNRAYVSKFLNAPPNLTMRSIAAMAIALGIKGEPKVILDPSDWILLDKGLRPSIQSDGYFGPVRLATADDGQDNSLSQEVPKDSNIIRFPVAHAASASNVTPAYQEMAGS